MKNNHKKIKKEFDKSLIPVIIASFVLVLLTASLVYVIIYVPSDEIYNLKAPDFKKLKIGVVENKNEMNSLRNLNYQNINVKYHLLKDYYRNDIVLNSVKTSFIDQEFIIRNNDLMEETKKEYISKVNLDGKLEWLTIIEDSNYKKIKIYEVIKYKDKYYLIAIGEKGNNYNLLAITLDNNGKIEKIKSIVNNFKDEIYKCFSTNDNIIILTKSTNILYIDYDLKLKKEQYNISNEKVFNDSYISIYNAKLLGNNLVLLVKVNSYLNKLPSEDYIVNVDISKKISNSYPVKNISSTLNNLMSRETFITNNKILYKLSTNKLNCYSLNGTYMGNIDYSKIELEQDDLHQISPYVEKNRITINSITDKYIKSETNFYRIYDLIDDNINVKKRYVIDNIDYYYDGVLLDTYLVNNKIYEIYKYNNDTPSILIAVVG